MVLTFEQAGDLLDEVAEPFPEALFEGLNGGVHLVREAMPDPEIPQADLFIMGEYHEDLLGRYINLYYGSFAVVAEREDWTEEDWRTELRQTLSHELTHHMEGRGGLHALDDKDEAQMNAWRAEYGEPDL